MTTPSERGALIKQIKNFPAELEALLAKYHESHYDQPVQPGEWTIRQIVHHLAEAHMNGFIRMKLVLAENKPILKPYDQDVWAAQADMKLPWNHRCKFCAGCISVGLNCWKTSPQVTGNAAEFTLRTAWSRWTNCCIFTPVTASAPDQIRKLSPNE
jgi:hypothetical protein